MEGVCEFVEYMMVDVFFFVMEGVLVVFVSVVLFFVFVYVVFVVVWWVVMW